MEAQPLWCQAAAQGGGQLAGPNAPSSRLLGPSRPLDGTLAPLAGTLAPLAGTFAPSMSERTTGGPTLPMLLALHRSAHLLHWLGWCSHPLHLTPVASAASHRAPHTAP